MGMRDAVRQPQEQAPVAVAPGDATSREVAASDAAAVVASGREQGGGSRDKWAVIGCVC